MNIVTAQNELWLDGPLTISERVDKKFEELGGFGRFQVFAYIAISFGLNA